MIQKTSEIKFLKEGKQGKQGARMKWVDWSTTSIWLSGNNGEEWQYYTFYSEHAYMCLKSFTKSTYTKTPAQSVADNDGYFIVADETFFAFINYLVVNKLTADEIDVASLIVEHLKTESTIDSKSLNIQSNEVQMTNESGEPSLQIDGNIVDSLSDLISSTTSTVSFPFASQTKQTNSSSSTPLLKGSIVMLDYADCGITDDKTYQVVIPQIKLSTSLTAIIGPESETSDAYAISISYANIYVEIEGGGTYIVLNKRYMTSTGTHKISKNDISDARAIYTNKKYRIVADYSIETYAYNTGRANASITIAKNDSASTISVAEVSKLTRIYGNGLIVKQATNKYLNVGTFADNSKLINAKDTDNTNSVYSLDMVYTNTSSNTWYRKWNNGWLECGGLLSATTNNRQTQNYPIAFISNPFVVTAPYGTEYSQSYEHGAIYANSTTYFTWERSDDFNLYWYACGLWKTLDN